MFFSQGTSFTPPVLPVLNNVAERIQSSSELTHKFERTLFVCVQHMVDNTASLFVDGLLSCGAKPENIFAADKIYSTYMPVIDFLKSQGINVFHDHSRTMLPRDYLKSNNKKLESMWDDVVLHLNKTTTIDRIVVLDEGGRCIERMPERLFLDYPLAVVEQTRGGFYSPVFKDPIFPVIDLAQSASKIFLESPIIAKAIIEKSLNAIDRLDVQEGEICGVIGNGAIGSALTEALLEKGYRVVAYDKNEAAYQNLKSVVRVKNIELVIKHAHVIFGCTGQDVFNDIDAFELIRKNKIFISCSSENREFKSLLDQLEVERNVNSDMILYSNNGNEFLCVNGAFPVNFTHAENSGSGESFQLTSALLLSSLAQAVSQAASLELDSMDYKESTYYQLDPAIQAFVAQDWLANDSLGSLLPETLKDDFSSSSWIAKNSAGKSPTTPEIAALFNSSNCAARPSM